MRCLKKFLFNYFLSLFKSLIYVFYNIKIFKKTKIIFLIKKLYSSVVVVLGHPIRCEL